jgi:tripartite-type tricarboxylate transporter receptor subunit TctC
MGAAMIRGTTMTSFHWRMIGMAALLLAAPAGAAAQTVDFKGETISIIIGLPPGGGYDTYGRVLARHYGNHLPGNPNVVPKNMPGAGGLRTANYIYNVAPKDGSELGLFASSAVMEPLMGNDQAKFDAAKYSWIGSMTQDIAFCGVWQGPGTAASFQDMLSKETIFGSSGPAAITHQHPLVLGNLLGAKVKLISGYAGTKDINLAMERGEVNGTCGLFVSSIKAQWSREVQDGRLKLVVQMGPRKSDEFGNVPSVYDLAKSDDDRKVLDLHFKQLLLSRPLIGPPGMRTERLAAMRKAFLDTLKDPAFLADAQKANIDIDPATGEQAEQMLLQFADFPKSVIEKAKAAIGR